MISQLENLMSMLSTRRRTPQDVVQLLKTEIAIAEAKDSTPQQKAKATENVSKAVTAIKIMLIGEEQKEALDENINALASMACDQDLLLVLASHLLIMAFETRKECVQVFNKLLKCTLPDGLTVSDQVADLEGNELQESLMNSYEVKEIALVSGAMLREYLRNEALTLKLLESEQFWKLFALVELSDYYFDVASDAFLTFREILTRHQTVVATFIESNYDKFFEHYHLFLKSPNYVSRRQALKLLGELLMERANFKIMTKYIASADNLKLIMNLLLDRGKHIQFEAFHVFKIFVANPHKSPAVETILKKNKVKMEAYLKNFLLDRQDEQFHEDRLQIIEEITLL